jgi:NADH dehydrogenase FAD-containing subunit
MSGGTPGILPPFRIAIGGGGITGAVAAAEISRWRRSPESAGAVSGAGTAAHVVLFDRGRRGPGGRAYKLS